MPSAKPQGAVRKSRKRSRRSRADSIDIVEQYEALYNRVRGHSRAETINAAFSDKELRILMGQNKLLINNFDPVTGKYTEKTKLQKAATLLTIIGEMVEPAELRVALPKPQRSSSRPIRRPTANDFKSSSDSDSSESSDFGPVAQVQQRSGSSGGIRSTGPRGGSGGGGSNRPKSGGRKGLKKQTPQHGRSDLSLSPTPSWPQAHLTGMMGDHGHGPYSSGVWSQQPDFSHERFTSGSGSKPPPDVCKAVAQATIAAAAHAEAAARAGKLKMFEDSTPDNDMSPGSMAAHLEMQHRMARHSQEMQQQSRGFQTHRAPMHMMAGESCAPPAALSVTGGGGGGHESIPHGQMPLSAWNEFSRTGGPTENPQPPMHLPTQKQHYQLPPAPQQLKPMQQHHLQQQPQPHAPQSLSSVTHRPQSPVSHMRLELDPGMGMVEAPWNVSDSLTSPIPPLIYSDDCQLNEADEEPGSARVPLSDNTNSPKSASATLGDLDTTRFESNALTLSSIEVGGSGEGGLGHDW